MLEKNNVHLKIDKLSMDISTLMFDDYTYVYFKTLKFIKDRDKSDLKHLKIDTGAHGCGKWKDVIKNVLFESISILN